VRSCNYCCSGKAIRVIHSECVFGALGIKHDAHEPYCHMLGVRLYNIFPHYRIKGTIFEKKKLLNIKCVFRFSLQRLSETLLILKRMERDVIKIVLFFHVKYRYSCPI